MSPSLIFDFFIFGAFPPSGLYFKLPINPPKTAPTNEPSSIEVKTAATYGRSVSPYAKPSIRPPMSDPTVGMKGRTK